MPGLVTAEFAGSCGGADEGPAGAGEALADVDEEPADEGELDVLADALFRCGDDIAPGSEIAALPVPPVPDPDVTDEGEAWHASKHNKAQALANMPVFCTC